MKITVSILLFWFALLTVQPTVAEVCRAMQSNEQCCRENKKECCEEEKDVPCKKEADSDCCGGGLCMPCSICSCCFTATIEKENFSFSSNAEEHYVSVYQNQNARSGFLSSPFQPPEFA